MTYVLYAEITQTHKNTFSVAASYLIIIVNIQIYLERILWKWKQRWKLWRKHCVSVNNCWTKNRAKRSRSRNKIKEHIIPAKGSKVHMTDNFIVNSLCCSCKVIWLSFCSLNFGITYIYTSGAKKYRQSCHDIIMDFDPEQRYVNMVNDIKVLSHKKNRTNNLLLFFDLSKSYYKTKIYRDFYKTKIENEKR